MLKTFYRRDKLNRIQVWMIEVSEAEGGLRTSEGLIDGAISTTSWTIFNLINPTLFFFHTNSRFSFFKSLSKKVV